jgi:hypothetical protein
MNKHLEYFIGIVFMPGSNLVVSVDDTSRIVSVLNESSPFNQTETEAVIRMGWRWHCGSRPMPD